MGQESIWIFLDIKTIKLICTLGLSETEKYFLCRLLLFHLCWSLKQINNETCKSRLFAIFCLDFAFLLWCQLINKFLFRLLPFGIHLVWSLHLPVPKHVSLGSPTSIWPLLQETGTFWLYVVASPWKLTRPFFRENSFPQSTKWTSSLSKRSGYRPLRTLCMYVRVYVFLLVFVSSKWAAPRENLSSGVCDQVRLKPACSATVAS